MALPHAASGPGCIAINVDPCIVLSISEHILEMVVTLQQIKAARSSCLEDASVAVT
jgi:hypothetical protein